MGSRQWAGRHQLWHVNLHLHYRGDQRDRGPIGSSAYFRFALPHVRCKRTLKPKDTQIRVQQLNTNVLFWCISFSKIIWFCSSVFLLIDLNHGSHG